MRRSISTNRPDSGRFDQSELAVTWKKITCPSPRLAAVTSGVPSLRRAQTFTSAPSEAGSASTCLLTSTSGGTGRPANRPSSPKGTSGCGVDHDSAPPSVRPPWRRGDGQQIVAALLEPRSGEANEHAALLHPLGDALVHVVGEHADVGQHEDGDVALHDGVDGRGQVRALALGDLGEGGQRALDIVERGEQRLRLLAGFARIEADAVPLRARIEQMHGARRALAGDLDAGDLVSELERQIEAGDRARVADIEHEGNLAEPLPARGQARAERRCAARPPRAAPAPRGGRRW